MFGCFHNCNQPQITLPSNFFGHIVDILPTKVSVEDTFGNLYDGLIGRDQKGKHFLETDTLKICDVINVAHTAILCFSYIGIGMFKLVVPYPMENLSDDDEDRDTDFDYYGELGAFVEMLDVDGDDNLIQLRTFI